MKKIFVLSLIFLLLFTLLTGCGGDQQPAEETQPKKEENDVVTTASIVNEEDDFREAISEDGTWIVATLTDMEFNEELVVEGRFRDKGDPNNKLYRKLALYAQDDDYNVTERYTITAPKLTVRSPNTKLQGGTFIGDINVDENGFTIEDAKVEGNVYFANEEYKSSFDMSDKGKVTGNTEVQ
jgi:hypothetical protein